MIIFDGAQPITANDIFRSIDENDKKAFANQCIALLQLGGVDTGVATHHISKEDVEKIREQHHDEVFVKSRLGYAALHCFPGLLEYSIQWAAKRLLSTTRPMKYTSHTYESQMVWYMLKHLKVTQVLRMFYELSQEHVNNKRTRKVCMWYFLNPPTSEEEKRSVNPALWAVKYRAKLRPIFTHFFGVGVAHNLKKVLKKKRWLERDRRYLQNHIDCYVMNPHAVPQAYECMAFILSSGSARDAYGKGFTLELLQQHTSVNTDFESGKNLPMDVLTGKRGTYHKDMSKKDLMKKSSKVMTEDQKFRMTRAAKKEGVNTRAKLERQSIKDLYVYVLSEGHTQETEVAITTHAERIAAQLPFQYDTIGILVDDSFSSTGVKAQALHPMASILSMRDVLTCAAQKKSYVASVTGRKFKQPVARLPLGCTDLAKPFLELVGKNPDAIFILSDGQDNTPSGRFQEVFELVREELGYHGLVYQCNPTASAATHVGRLSPGIPVIPALIPEKVATSLAVAVMEADPLKGLSRFIDTAIANYQTYIDESKNILARDMTRRLR